MTPEQEARKEIDTRLQQAGWILQNQAEMNIFAGLGVAVLEMQLNSGFADYGLYVDGKVIGVIEVTDQPGCLEIESCRFFCQES